MIVVTGPNELMAVVHDRMPVILDSRDWDTWLTGTPDEARYLFRPLPSELLDAYPVSTRINKPANDDPAMIGPTH